MKTMWPPSYHDNGFVAPHALGHMINGWCNHDIPCTHDITVHHVPKRMNFHKAIAVITGGRIIFILANIYIYIYLYISMYIYRYIYIYIYIYILYILYHIYIYKMLGENDKEYYFFRNSEIHSACGTIFNRLSYNSQI